MTDVEWARDNFVWCGPNVDQDECGFPGKQFPSERELLFPPPEGTPNVTCRFDRCDWTCLDRPERHAHGRTKRPQVHVPRPVDELEL